jgi:3-deoxy-D-manno-octulosonate 8-phosphate phosphatase (KDO 8-P phosphatase)
MSGQSLTLAARAARVKLLVLDVDGVLTDGRVVYDADGREIKFFDIQDGHGIKILQRTGVKLALLSGRESNVNRIRAQELGIEELHEDCKVKLPVFEKILTAHGLKAEQVAFMGDDLIDLPPMRVAGLALAPSNAVLEVKQAAHWVALKPGGAGAVRLACELIMKSAGTWQEATARYF